MFSKKQRIKKDYEVGKGYLEYLLKDATIKKSEEIKGDAFAFSSTDDVVLTTAEEFLKNSIKSQGKVGFFSCEDGSYINSDKIDTIKIMVESHKVSL